jgi:hypothetical protein
VYDALEYWHMQADPGPEQVRVQTGAWLCFTLLFLREVIKKRAVWTDGAVTGLTPGRHGTGLSIYLVVTERALTKFICIVV